ncbi:MAG: HK97-gp10 family putative phage morphogenesis protein [Terriglobales bacterium]
MLAVTSQFAPRSSIGQFASVVMSPRVKQAVQDSCVLIQNIAKGYCPVDTGALQDSITISEPTEGLTITQSVAPHMFYASYVEYGTGRRGDPAAPYAHVESWPGMSAQPYMRPALDEGRGQVLDVFQRELGGPWGV